MAPWDLHLQVPVCGREVSPVDQGCRAVTYAFVFLLGRSHPTSCCSAAEIMAVLFFHTMRYKATDPRSPHNDRFVLSKVGGQPSVLHLGLGGP